MEKCRRVLVLGDNSVGKTSFLESLFNSFRDNIKETKEVKINNQHHEETPQFPKRTEGCIVHVHNLNHHYPELNEI